VRFGDTYSAKIPVGEADAILCLEISEIASVIHYLKPEGEIWTNTGRIHGYYTKLRPELYPTQEEIEGLARLKTSHLYALPAERLALEAGSPQAVNMVMLGAFSSGNSLLKIESITWAIEEGNRRFVAANLEAFQKGYEFAKKRGAC
jgi:indolepyruvate ferredoxin oxidoreductase beta subunit